MNRTGLCNRITLVLSASRLLSVLDRGLDGTDILLRSQRLNKLYTGMEVLSTISNRQRLAIDPSTIFDTLKSKPHSLYLVTGHLPSSLLLCKLDRPWNFSLAGGRPSMIVQRIRAADRGPIEGAAWNCHNGSYLGPASDLSRGSMVSAPLYLTQLIENQHHLTPYGDGACKTTVSLVYRSSSKTQRSETC